MAELHRNLIFFDKKSEVMTWVNESGMESFPYNQVQTMVKNEDFFSGSQMKFYYKRRCRDGRK